MSARPWRNSVKVCQQTHAVAHRSSLQTRPVLAHEKTSVQLDSFQDELLNFLDARADGQVYVLVCHLHNNTAHNFWLHLHSTQALKAVL